MSDDKEGVGSFLRWTAFWTDLMVTGGAGTAVYLAGWLGWKGVKAVLPPVGRGIASTAGAVREAARRRADEAQASRARAELKKNPPPPPPRVKTSRERYEDAVELIEQSGEPPDMQEAMKVAAYEKFILGE